MCDWYAACDNPPDGVVSHPVLGDVLTCERCAARHSLDLRVPEFSEHGSDQHKAEWRCRWSDALTMLAHHGTTADFEAAVRKEIALYRLEIDPDAVDYAALRLYAIGR